ncbi:MAG: type II secretion system protein GspE [Planctomycetes bacterium]|nr:type II secretion system protein GspE [Planctomycetota bacterium]
MKDILLEKLAEKLPQEKLDDALRIEAESGQTLDRIILRKQYLPEDEILQTFADALGYPFRVDLEGIKVPASFSDLVPIEFSRNYSLIGIEEADGVMTVATCSPFEIHPMDDLAAILGMEVEPVFVPRAAITIHINRAYRHKADMVDEAIETIEEESLDDLSTFVSESEDLLDVANKAPIIKLVNMVLFQALKMRASDVHIQPFEDRVQIRYRIDGVLYDMESVPKKVQDAVISRVKVMGKMDIAERRIPQDGRATIKIGDSEVDVRISTVPTNHGERIVMRLLDKTTNVYKLDEIGLSPDHLKTLRHIAHLSHGIIFVTGPTGSGKTTTLYATLSEIDSTTKNIITIEDPIEYHLAGISQIQVADKKGLTFAAGLRSLLRQDPDVMMIGEVRDEQTARIAIQAALTGHLVFSTLHTNDSAGAVSRMLDIGVEPYLVASSLISVIAQRLVRVICSECRMETSPSQEDLKLMRELKLAPTDLPNGQLARGGGCDNCFNTGYTGRTAIYEMLDISEDVRTLVVDRASATVIKRAGMAQGLVTLRADGIRKVLEGVTTIEEVLRVTQMDIE